MKKRDDNMQKFSNYLLNNNVGLKEEINSKLINLMMCLNNKELKESITDEEYVYLTYSSNTLLMEYKKIISNEKIILNELFNINVKLDELLNNFNDILEKNGDRKLP